MIWSGDKVPITANKDDAAVFYYCSLQLCSDGYLSIATECNLSCQNHKYREGMDGTEQTQKSTKGCDLGMFQVDFEITANRHKVAQPELPVWAYSN